MTESNSIVPIERIERHILLIRGHKVMLDSDLAELYGVGVKVLNQAVRRNIRKRPVNDIFPNPCGCGTISPLQEVQCNGVCGWNGLGHA